MKTLKQKFSDIVTAYVSGEITSDEFRERAANIPNTKRTIPETYVDENGKERNDIYQGDYEFTGFSKSDLLIELLTAGKISKEHFESMLHALYPEHPEHRS